MVAMTHVLGIKPRVIAAEVKSQHQHNNYVKFQSKPHISGELDLVGETTSEPHYVEVRDGVLLLYPGRVPQGPALWRLPLTRLNLQPASSGRPRGFSLSRHGEKVPLATFQVGSDIEYERWVKTLAAELMRQTPLDAVRFLDILGITATLSSPHNSPLPLRRTQSADNVGIESTPRPLMSTCSSIQEEEISTSTMPRNTQSLHRQKKSCIKVPVSPRRRISLDSANSTQRDANLVNIHNNDIVRITPCSNFYSLGKDNLSPKDNKQTDIFYERSSENSPESKISIWESAPLPDVIRDLPPCERRSRTRIRADSSRRSRGLSAEPINWLSDDTITQLMARCQQDDQYVPVRDKRLLFETLCRRHFVCSTDNISLAQFEPGSLAKQQRAQSLHDLSQCHSVAVKDICRYFEQRVPSHHHPISKKRAYSDRQQFHRAERRLARARQNLAVSEDTVWRLQEEAYQIRNKKPEVIASIEEQLTLERDRLKQQKDEVEKLQQYIDHSVDQFGLITAKARHHSNIR